MISFPNAKINIGLHITEKRKDGFHNIETVFYPVKWCDALEVVPGSKNTTNKFNLKLYGLPITGSPTDNLLIRACNFFDEIFKLPEIQLHLYKNIPMGAGLGGGSSDAAFLLKMLNEISGAGFSDDDLKKLASKLGSDCSFFVENKPLYATGKGDIFEAIELALDGIFIVIIYPGINSNTAQAYSKVIPDNSRARLSDIITAFAPAEWSSHLHNDFETSVFASHPQIAKVKEQIYEAGAFYASLSGSGSAVYGLFEKQPELQMFAAPNFTVYSGIL